MAEGVGQAVRMVGAVGGSSGFEDTFSGQVFDELVQGWQLTFRRNQRHLLTAVAIHRPQAFMGLQEVPQQGDLLATNANDAHRKTRTCWSPSNHGAELSLHAVASHPYLTECSVAFYDARSMGRVRFFSAGG